MRVARDQPSASGAGAQGNERSRDIGGYIVPFHMKDYGYKSIEELEQLIPEGWSLSKRKDRQSGKEFWSAERDDGVKVSATYFQNLLFRVFHYQLWGEDIPQELKGGVSRKPAPRARLARGVSNNEKPLTFKSKKKAKKRAQELDGIVIDCQDGSWEVVSPATE
jgi:hypothetical protein